MVQTHGQSAELVDVDKLVQVDRYRLERLVGYVDVACGAHAVEPSPRARVRRRDDLSCRSTFRQGKDRCAPVIVLIKVQPEGEIVDCTGQYTQTAWMKINVPTSLHPMHKVRREANHTRIRKARTRIKVGCILPHRSSIGFSIGSES